MNQKHYDEVTELMEQGLINPEGLFGDEDEISEHRHCDQCRKLRNCELIPLHGYSEWFCRQCAAKAYRTGEAI